ncbi:hypothetical protein EDD18DRAFT_1100455 [Armillaria luteobubalina]|uniref:Uncharacterized protein n=1 Tax=Armillaria luteobubalina TaxID=153913 RepID=A0AA39QFI4_9AGAR|nr:hypothetical protein EDD18DRAFT_1100455 [Armillaria luteobubalina]
MEGRCFDTSGVGEKSLEVIFSKLLFAQMYLPRSSATARLLKMNYLPSDTDRGYFEAVIEHGWDDIYQLSQKLVRARDIVSCVEEQPEFVEGHVEESHSVVHLIEGDLQVVVQHDAWDDVRLRSRGLTYARAVAGYLEAQLKLAEGHIEDAQSIVHPMRWSYGGVGWMPWILSHVCGHWRLLVRNSGRLWTRVLLDFKRGEPLASSGHGTPMEPSTNPILLALIPFSHRFRTMTMDAGGSLYQFLSACKMPFTRLHTLSIGDMSYHLFEGHDTEDPYHDLTLDVFAFVPNLECLQVSVVPLRCFYFEPLTLNAVTRFSVSLYSQWTTVFSLAVRMSRLEYLDLTCDCDIDETEDGVGHVSIPSLRKLVLRNPDSRQNIPIVWDKVDVSTVSTTILLYKGEFSVVAYPRLFVSAGCITELHVHIGEESEHFDYGDSSIDDFLRKTPNVAVFCLQTSRYCPKLFQRFSQDPYFLLKLRDLTFVCMGYVNAKHNAGFVDAVYIRTVDPVFHRIEKIGICLLPSCATDITRHKWDVVFRRNKVVVGIGNSSLCCYEH